MDRKIVVYLLVGFVLFTLYNTLLPFQFDYGWGDLGEQFRKITWRLFYRGDERVSLTDIVGNVLLFMPFGFLMYMFLNDRGSRHPIILSTVFGALLSLLIEFLQLFIAGRNTAPHDLLNNTAGSMIGAVFASVYSLKVSAIARRTFYDLLDRKPFVLIVSLIGLAQVIAAVMPPTVSITVSSFKRSIKSANIIPFTYQSIGALYFDTPNNNDALPFDMTKMIEDLLFWAVVGYLLMICYRIYWKKKPAAIPLMVALPPFFFGLLEIMQLFIMSRISDLNDIISGCAGIYTGYLLYNLLRKWRRRQFETELDLLKIPLGLYLLFIVFAGCRPFDWSFSSTVIGKDLMPENLIPFFAYFRSTSLWNIYDLVNSLTYFLPLSLYWSYRMKEAGRGYPSIYLHTVLAGLALGAFIEFTQLLSNIRTAEITDVLAYSGSGALGTFLVYYYEQSVLPTLHMIRRGVLDLR